jgi:RHS repeat-associated protein
VNEKGLPESVTNPSNIVTEYAYNNYGNLRTTIIPSLGISATINYDAASRITDMLDFLNRTTAFTYDNKDNLLTETDALNRTTSYAYDANDNLTTITNAKGGVTTLTYDNISDWLTSVTFGGSTKSYDYNDDGTLKKFTKPDGTQLNSTYDGSGRITSDGVNSYEYDNEHRLWKITKGGKTLQYTYDGFNQITGVTYDSKTVNYTYDNNGNILTVAYPDNKTVTYTYDNLNRMKTVKDWNNRTITYNYFADNRMQSISYPNGMTVTYAYDNAGRQTGKTIKRSDNTVIASYSFTLDNAGNILTETRTEPYTDVSPPNENVSYAYNSVNRITQAGNISFTFDANGNTKTRESSSYSYDNLDKLTSGDGFSFEYDGLGNIRSNGTRHYWIDIMGMGNVIAETDMSNNPTAYYIYGAGGLEARILTNDNTEYYVSDYRGSVVAMTDATTSANITHQYQYDEFGKIVQQQESDANPFRYVGKYGVMYANDNLYYMRARFYDPTIGRFLSEDPIWNTNLYPYADNNPIMRIDPKGTSSTLEVVNQAVEVAPTAQTVTKAVYEVVVKPIFDEAAADADGWLNIELQMMDAFDGIKQIVQENAPELLSAGGAGGMSVGAYAAGGAIAVTAAAGTTLIAVSVYNAAKSTSNSKNLADFVNNMDKSGDPIYHVSQWLENQVEQGLDATIGKMFF